MRKLSKDCLDHERLDVYKVSIEFIILIDRLVEILPRGRGYLIDQLKRAGSSIPLNIAEGAGEFASIEKIRFYRMARRSATECAAILDVCLSLKLIDPDCYLIVSMSASENAKSKLNDDGKVETPCRGVKRRSSQPQQAQRGEGVAIWVIDQTLYETGRDLIIRIVAMLTKMTQK